MPSLDSSATRIAAGLCAAASTALAVCGAAAIAGKILRENPLAYMRQGATIAGCLAFGSGTFVALGLPLFSKARKTESRVSSLSRETLSTSETEESHQSSSSEEESFQSLSTEEEEIHSASSRALPKETVRHKASRRHQDTIRERRVYGSSKRGPFRPRLSSEEEVDTSYSALPKEKLSKEGAKERKASSLRRKGKQRSDGTIKDRRIFRSPTRFECGGDASKRNADFHAYNLPVSSASGYGRYVAKRASNYLYVADKESGDLTCVGLPFSMSKAEHLSILQDPTGGIYIVGAPEKTRDTLLIQTPMDDTCEPEAFKLRERGTQLAIRGLVSGKDGPLLIYERFKGAHSSLVVCDLEKPENRQTIQDAAFDPARDVILPTGIVQVRETKATLTSFGSSRRKLKAIVKDKAGTLQRARLLDHPNDPRLIIWNKSGDVWAFRPGEPKPLHKCATGLKLDRHSPFLLSPEDDALLLVAPGSGRQFARLRLIDLSTASVKKLQLFKETSDLRGLRAVQDFALIGNKKDGFQVGALGAEGESEFALSELGLSRQKH